jgi:hypothetical protein
MARDRLAGMDTLLKLFDTLPKATEDELKSDLPKIGSIVLGIERGAVAVRTGDLFRGLTTQVLNGGLKIRIGLVGATSRSGKTSYNLYYGRFVEFGRGHQIVQVERRRRVGGRLRTQNRRKRASDIVARYNLNVRAEPPRPFVNTPQAETAALDGIEALADFWSKVLARSGVSA